jgi:hypothetical protein
LDQKSVLAGNFVFVFYGLFPLRIGYVFLRKYFAVMFTGVVQARRSRERVAAVTLRSLFFAAL